MSFFYWWTSKNTFSASDRMIIAAGNFHSGRGSTSCGFWHFHMPNLNGDGESATARGAPTSNVKASMDGPGQTETAFPSRPTWNQFYFFLKTSTGHGNGPVNIQVILLNKENNLLSLFQHWWELEATFHVPWPMELPYVSQNISWLD